MDNQLPKSVLIVGAGPSGLFAARALQKLAKDKKQSITITILENQDHVGGKCYTFSDPLNPKLKTEWGAALVAPNYGVVIDALDEHKLKYENLLSTNQESIEILQLIDNMPLSKKPELMKDIGFEIWQFNKDYEIYKKAKQKKTMLQDNLLQPFSEYAAQKNMKYLPILFKAFVPGFGYGALNHCPTYSVLEYFGTATVPDILLSSSVLNRPPLLQIQGGFQLLFEKIAEGMDVRLNANVNKIVREEGKVTAQYEQNGQTHTITADTLILANSPRNWPKLGLDFTEVEKQCVEQLEFYRYPVAVCKIKGLPPEQYYFKDALEETGFGHLALITTRDNRKDPEDGRLCTIYVNLKPGENDFKFNHEKLTQELMAIKGVTEVNFLAEKIWEDYMSTLPWDLRMKLSKAQNNTLYLGSYALGGFEDVVSVANKASDEVKNRFRNKVSFEEDKTLENISRAWQFYTAPVYPSVGTKPEPSVCVLL